MADVSVEPVPIYWHGFTSKQQFLDRTDHLGYDPAVLATAKRIRAVDAVERASESPGILISGPSPDVDTLKLAASHGFTIYQL